ncbi:starch phosphorylase [Desulfitispora alkaliphila]|uniref:alpha-glucan family phosphorylase n=1 Tax=Desulfitispora alkaliphila TaxID=622674 RepID=UPI003D20455A
MTSNGKKPTVAYFCMEYGLNRELPIYSGGLGILAGDFLKAAKDENAPVIGIGILWKQDYTQQYIGDDRRPFDVYPNFDYSFLKDTGVSVQLNVRGEEVTCKVHMVDQYGNAPLYLLDTNFPGSSHGWMTSKLYGGVEQDRVAAEMILGIGGIKALRAMNIDIDQYHFNEGHAVFAGIELIREKMQEQHMSFEDAMTETKRQVAFTTHTPVEAGNEVHDHGLLEYMGAYNGLNRDQMTRIGGDPFGMTVAALRLSHTANAVSQLHGDTARQMWKDVSDAAPIISITNGVHGGTWQSPSIRNAYKQGRDLWQPHMDLKEKLVRYIKEKTGKQFKKENLIVGFARRAAAYKRSGLIFSKPEVIEPLLQEGKLQLVFSGKAHPKDEPGKDIIQNIMRMSEKYPDSIVFLENYDMYIGELLVQGVDVWLNNPRRPMEASGTSGMKAAMNGVLNVSVIDGWVPEGVEHRSSGWLIDKMLTEMDQGDNEDVQDIKALYRVLLDEVIPTYYNNRTKWLEMMHSSITMSKDQFSSARMLKQYFSEMYEKNFEDDAPQMMAGAEQQNYSQQNQYDQYPQQ